MGPAVLRSLNRDEWEDLCLDLVSRMEGAHRVEDRKGRGNGLDAYVVDKTGVRGWQIRRYDSSFGAPQERKLRSNIDLAIAKVPLDFGKPLSSFTLWFSIDLQPTHKRSKGGVKRLHGVIDDYARQNLKIEYQGLRRVWTHLNLNRDLAPHLFDNPMQEIRDSLDKLKSLLEPADIDESIMNSARELLKKANELAATGATLSGVARACNVAVAKDFIALTEEMVPFMSNDHDVALLQCDDMTAYRSAMAHWDQIHATNESLRSHLLQFERELDREVRISEWLSTALLAYRDLRQLDAEARHFGLSFNGTTTGKLLSLVASFGIHLESK